MSYLDDEIWNYIPKRLFFPVTSLQKGHSYTASQLCQVISSNGLQQDLLSTTKTSWF